MKLRLCGFVLIAIACIPAATTAQQYGIAPHVGTMGVGVDVAYAAAPRIGLRAGFNVMPINLDFTEEDIDFTLSLQSPQITAMADLFLVGPLRLSGGVRYTSSGITLDADVSSTVDLGTGTYSLDSLTGTIVTPDISPYIGIGIGNPAGSKLGFFLDLGVAILGEPEFQLDAYGTATSLPGFSANLEAERSEIEAELDTYFKIYPVISVGFSIGF